MSPVEDEGRSSVAEVDKAAARTARDFSQEKLPTLEKRMPPEPGQTGRLSFPQLQRPSALVLILANLAPVYGVVFLGWKVFPVILLFWLENLVIGTLNVFRLLLADPWNRPLWLLKAFFIPFFCIHYSLFMFVHGIFVMGLFGGMFRAGAPFPDAIIVLAFIREYNLGWAIAGLAASHVVSLVANYVGEGEYLKANPAKLMQQPYGRIVVLHITIIAGGMFVMVLQSPIVGLLLLVILKIALDLRSHLREHQVVGSPIPQPGD